MRIIRARTAGFCMGVSLALRALDGAVPRRRQGGRLVMFGPIIHNPQVLQRYADRGVECLEDPDRIRRGDTVIIRAHGIPRTIEERLCGIGAVLVDATCPKVKAAQDAIAKATAGGVELLLFGETEHPEVRGLLSYAHAGSHVFVDTAYADSLDIDPSTPLVLASQTTQDKNAFDRIAASLAARYGNLTLLSTICDATERRQSEALALSRSSDAVVVIGGRTSGNTRRLVEIVRLAGVPVHQVETADDLPMAELSGVSVVGVTAGASTPSDIIDDVCRRLGGA